MSKTLNITIFAEDYEDLHEQVAEMVKKTGCVPSGCVVAGYTPLASTTSTLTFHTAFGTIPLRVSRTT